MSEEVTYTDHDGDVFCAGCGGSYVLLNQFGLCADCYGNLSDDKREALGGFKVVPQIIRESVTEKTVTINRPVPSLFHVAGISVVLSVAAAVAVAIFAPNAAAWLSHFLK